MYHFAQPAAKYRRQAHWREWWLPRPLRNWPEILGHELFRFLYFEIAGDRQHCVVRRVVCREELRDIVQRRCGKIFHRSDQRVLKRMRWGEYQLLHLLEHRTVWLVVHRAPALVLHDIALSVQLLLSHRRQKLTHAVGFQPKSQGKLIRWDSLEVIRALEPGRPVERSTRALDQLEVLVGSDVLRTLKQHVLEQMRESRSSGFLVRRSDVIPEIHCHDRGGMILRQRDEQAVVQRKGFNRNSHCRKLPAMQSHWNPLAVGM